jgi:hypothetical protein
MRQTPMREQTLSAVAGEHAPTCLMDSKDDQVTAAHPDPGATRTFRADGVALFD